MKGIEQNIAMLHGLIASHPNGAERYRRAATELADAFLDAVEGPQLDPHIFQLNQRFLDTRIAFWGRILAAPDPRRAFVRWLLHLEKIANGTIRCGAFEKYVLGDERKPGTSDGVACPLRMGEQTGAD